MSEKTRQQYIFFTSEREDEFDEDIDNYDNERFNVYDDGIDLHYDTETDDLDDDDDDLIEDEDTTLPLFNLEDDEYSSLDEMDD